VPADQVEDCLAALIAAGYPDTVAFGQVVADGVTGPGFVQVN
jgi:hypothetical protein